MVTDINGKVPDPSIIENLTERSSVEQALKYMGLKANLPIQEISIDRVLSL